MDKQMETETEIATGVVRCVIVSLECRFQIFVSLPL